MKLNKGNKLLLLALLLIAVFTVGCSTQGLNKDQSNDVETSKDGDKPVVTVTTSFLNDMVYQIAGDTVAREMIIPAGEDPHLYVAKPEDLDKLSKGDLILYHGLHFEGKMVDLLEDRGVAVTKNFDESDIGEFDQDGEIIDDPHFWFDIDLYKKAVNVASEELQKLLPENEQMYQDNTEKYLKALDELDEYNQKELSNIPEENRYLITPHDAFNYFSRRYDMPVIAPQGVSTDSEVAVSEMDNTVNFIVDHQVKAIFAESTTDPKRMESLKEAAAQKGFDVKVVSGEDQELFSDSLAPEGKPGDTYIDMYKHNTDLIVENLK